ncbi:transglycosylase SLT domain-containing protein [Actinocrispum sp. NPDC049592]|uniref:transglycosylase SLT domain-containing protein n=1 Tax=Actinocrispum sp. NPDC049592 TaxID=3154835 RepID=UPI003426EE2A
MGSAAETVAGYPGGDAVLAAANKVEHANSGAIKEAADRLTKAGTGMGTNGKGVADAVKTLDDAWQGASADQFVSYMSRFANAGTATAESMTKAGGALGKVATAIDEAKSFVSTRCEGVIGEVNRFRQQNPDATPEQFDAAVRPICQAAATDIENKLKETESVLSGAASEIKAAANLSTRFTDIPDPGTQPYVPQHGNVAGWDRTPLQQQDSTTNTAAATPAANHAAAGSGSGGGGGGHTSSGGGSGSFHGSLGSSGGPPAGPVPGNVQDWIKQALEILRANGINVSEADVPKIWAIIQHESGGNPHAINNWDSNAAKGTPSKGLMQCIDPTFNSYKIAGHNDIWNPVDNICAGVNYAISRYGSLDNVPGIKAMAGGGAYRGY